MIYTLDDVRDIYRNTDHRMAVELSSYTHFTVPVTEPCYVNYVDFLVLKRGQCTGQLIVEMRGDRALQYKIDIATLPTNAPLRLSTESLFRADKVLSLSLAAKYSEGSPPLAIWTSHEGPCVVVNARVNRTIEIKNPHKISVITPVYKPTLEHLKEAIKSVREQVYGNWELCLVDDGSNDPELSSFLRSLKNGRVKVRINKNNKGIAGASNDALAMATGTYVCFLDNDDLLTKDALLEVAAEIDQHPDVDLIYTDEDKVGVDGQYHGAFYKPDWNYKLLLSHMYTCHLSTYRKSIVEAAGAFRAGYDGSQDYDLVLRVIERTQAIRHIPKVLYHWRILPGSTSESIANKPQARINAVRAIESHLNRVGVFAHVLAGPFQGHYRIKRDIMHLPSVEIIIPFRDRVDLLGGLMHTVVQTTYQKYHVTLVDNNSREPATKEFLKKLGNRATVLQYKKPFNWSAINNWAASQFKADLLLFLNNDVEIMDQEWLEEMVREFEDKEVGVVGAKLLYLDHRIQHAGVVVGITGVAGHSHKEQPDWQPGYFGRPHVLQEVTAVTGACMMVRRTDFNEVGGFNEALPKAFNDVDLCLEMRKRNKKVIYTPYSRLYHLESASRGLDSVDDQEFQRAISLITNKWHLADYRDPYYNPNLTRKRTDFSMGV